MDIINTYKTQALKTVKNFQNDVNIDAEFIKINFDEPGNKGNMIFFLRENGSYLMELTQRAINTLPRGREKVKYLFGYADRETILENGYLEMIKPLSTPYYSEKILMLNVEKKTLKHITLDTAINYIHNFVKEARA